MPRMLKVVAVLSTLCMLAVLIGGALVTKTGSGQGCGSSWPLCNGQLVPTDITLELIIELSHRLVSGFASILILTFAIWSWKRIGHIRETKFLAVLSVFFLLLQALIGAAAVVWGQSAPILALHFGISLISFSAVFLLTLLIFEVDKKFEVDKLHINKSLRKQILLLSIYCYIVVYTGALVRHKEATLACIDFPFCNNDSLGLPTTSFEWVQMGHRFAAIIFFIWLFLLTIHVIRKYRNSKALYWSFITAMILITLQVITGISIIYTMGSLYMALFHALIISCLFGIISYLLLLASRSRKQEAGNKLVKIQK